MMMRFEMPTDFVTNSEKWGRDKLLLPFTYPFRNLSWAPNALTIAGFCITLIAICDFYLHRSVERQIWLLTVGWLTDFLDGPMARNNKCVTALGTFLDLFRDFCLALWTLCLDFMLVPKENDFWLLRWIIVGTVVGKFGIATGIYLFAREQRNKWRRHISLRLFLEKFFLRDLRISWVARGHTFFLGLGGTTYLGGPVIAPFWSELGAILLAFQLVFLGASLYEVWSPYEERYRRAVHFFRRKIKKMQERMRPRDGDII